MEYCIINTVIFMRKNKTYILVDGTITVSMIIIGIIFAAFMYGLGTNEYESFHDALTDPVVIAGIIMCMIPFVFAVNYFVLTDDEIKTYILFFPVSRMRYEDIIEIGVKYGENKRGKDISAVSYIRHIDHSGEERYSFMSSPSKNLCAYLIKNGEINMVEDTLDARRKNELRQPGRTAFYVNNFIYCILIIILGSISGFIAFYIISVKLWRHSIVEFVLVTGHLIAFSTIFSGFLGSFFAYNAKFRFEGDHVIVKFPLHKEIRYNWGVFQEICICYYNEGKRDAPKRIVICFVKKGVNKTRIHQRWPVEDGFNYRKIPYMQYSEDALAEVKKYCPYDIVDLRGKGTYYH